jgi:hypothetical protein
MSIFQVLINNDVTKAFQHESKIQKLKIIDLSHDEEKINNNTLLKGQVCNMIVSFSKDQGRILSTKSQKIAAFFGYELWQFEGV